MLKQIILFFALVLLGAIPGVAAAGALSQSIMVCHYESEWDDLFEAKRVSKSAMNKKEKQLILSGSCLYAGKGQKCTIVERIFSEFLDKVYIGDDGPFYTPIDIAQENGCTISGANGNDSELLAGVDVDWELYFAAVNGKVKVIIALAEAGADVNQANKNGATPLHNAAWYGHAKVIVALAEVGADVNKAADNGVTPLHNAAWRGHAKAIVALAEVGADVNKADKNGSTPLLYAASKGHAKAAIALVKAGADISLKSVKGNTAADVAEREQGKNAEVTKFLRNAEARKKSQSEQGDNELLRQKDGE